MNSNSVPSQVRAASPPTPLNTLLGLGASGWAWARSQVPKRAGENRVGTSRCLVAAGSESHPTSCPVMRQWPYLPHGRNRRISENIEHQRKLTKRAQKHGTSTRTSARKAQKPIRKSRDPFCSHEWISERMGVPAQHP